MATLRSARERARTEIRGEILAMARRHLAEQGPAGLSLRAVARDLGLVSSAVYRYFENRDALLTALIVDSYESLGGATEASVSGTAGRPPRERWVAAALTIRAWAVAHPHEYALLYGSPVPGYAAPDDTVAPGVRVSLALVSIVRDAQSSGGPADAAPVVLSDGVALELTQLAAVIGGELPPAVLLATVLAWTQLFGLLSFELFGQTRGLADDREGLFRDAAATMAAHIGL